MPPVFAEIEDAKDHLRRTLQKRSCQCPRALAWMLPEMVAHVARERIHRRDRVSPGREMLTRWARAKSEKTATRHFQTLAGLAWPVVIILENRRGGPGRPVTWSVDPDGLKRWLVGIGANPHPVLLERLSRLLSRPIPGVDDRPDAQIGYPKNGGHFGRHFGGHFGA